MQKQILLQETALINVRNAARDFRTAEQNFQSAFRNYFTDEISALSYDRFWQLQPIFRDEVIDFRLHYGRSNGIEQAARESFRKPLAADFSGTKWLQPR